MAGKRDLIFLLNDVLFQLKNTFVDQNIYLYPDKTDLFIPEAISKSHMKKFFSFIGIVLLLAVIFVLVSGLFFPKSYHFERNIMIGASKEEVWKNVSLFSNAQYWNPWIIKDPDRKQSISGVDGTPGAVFSWNSKDHENSGSQTFKKLVPYEYISLALDIQKPFHHKAEIYYKLEQIETSVKVTWRFDCTYQYPVNAIMYLFYDKDDDLDRDFSSGLANLKKRCENSRIMVAYNVQHTATYKRSRETR
jgi:hypothetical protein